MLLDFDEILKTHRLKIKGIIHIGAHFGQEFQLYKKHNIQNLMFFEPINSTFQRLKENVGEGAKLLNTALGNFEGEVEMFTETVNQGQSSSVLQPDYHLVQHPSIQFNGKEKVKITKLDNFIEESENYNFINIDVQGYELEVFKGGSKFLNHIDYIITEVNRAELYKNCAKVEELDEFLKTYGFERIQTNWAGHTWGDALYIKKNNER